jgi:Txe/YoeB family toxin of Txe-Axe toxin-antitoxin module
MAFEFVDLDDSLGLDLDNLDTIDLDSSVGPELDPNGANIDDDIDAAAAGAQDPSGASDPEEDEVITDEALVSNVDYNIGDQDQRVLEFLGVRTPDKGSQDVLFSYFDAIDKAKEYAQANEDLLEDLRLDEEVESDPVGAIRTYISSTNPMLDDEDIEGALARFVTTDGAGDQKLTQRGMDILNNTIRKPLKHRIKAYREEMRKKFSEEYERAISDRQALISTVKTFAMKPAIEGVELGDIKIPKSMKLKLANAVREYKVAGATPEEKLENAAFMLPELRKYIISEVAKKAAEAAKNQMLKR